MELRISLLLAWMEWKKDTPVCFSVVLKNQMKISFPLLFYYPIVFQTFLGALWSDRNCFLLTVFCTLYLQVCSYMAALLACLLSSARAVILADYLASNGNHQL